MVLIKVCSAILAEVQTWKYSVCMTKNRNPMSNIFYRFNFQEAMICKLKVLLWVNEFTDPVSRGGGGGKSARKPTVEIFVFSYICL